MTLQVEKMTRENSRIYGELIRIEDSTPSYKGDDFSFFKNLGSIPFEGKIGFSMVETYMDRSAELRWLEKHKRSKEVIITTDLNIILVLGTGTDATEPDCIQALELEAGSAFIINEDVWHHAPVSTGTKTRVGILLSESTPDTDLEKIDVKAITLK